MKIMRKLILLATVCFAFTSCRKNIRCEWTDKGGNNQVVEKSYTGHTRQYVNDEVVKLENGLISSGMTSVNCRKYSGLFN